MEVWKDIYFIENGIEWDYRGLYQVSNLGNVKSLNYNGTGKEKKLKPGKNKFGYFQVILCKNGKVKEFRVNRLVAYMFIKNDDPLNKTQVNHKDENKENNSVDNLEWATPKENSNHGTRNERSAKARSRKVIGYSLTNTKVIVLQSVRQGKLFGFNPGAICKCCNGKRKSHKGYVWKYIN